MTDSCPVPPAASHAFDLHAPVIRRGAALPVARVRQDPFEGTRFTVLSAVTDGVMLWIAAACAIAISGIPTTSKGFFLAVGFSAVTMLRLGRDGMYGQRPARMSALDTVRVVSSSVMVAVVVALAVAALAGVAVVTIHTLVLTGVMGVPLLAGFRLAIAQARRQARIRGVSGKRAIIVGAGHIGIQLERRLRAMPELGLEPVGFLDADPSPAYRDAGTVAPILGAPADLAKTVRRTGAEHVIIAFSAAPDSTVQPLIRQCDELGLEVSVVPRLFESVSDRQWVEHVGGLPLVGLHRVDPKSWQFAVKHAIDRVFAALLLIACAPVFGALALGVKLSSPGPVFYRQRRVGRDGQEFEILKFRSMRMAPAVATDELKAQLAEAGAAPGGIEGQDRRTQIGTLLRRTSLDELPQLANVLLGHMSLVGPRPERPDFVDHFGTTVRRYDDRHRVKSGMTGWAQVHGLRGQTSLTERIEWDNWYIQNWSLWLDLKILLMTPMACVKAPSEDIASATARPAPEVLHVAA
ncbi:MAG: sugar transferase [Solirubrobacteraceae bacterium]|nr:sugar transferase [Solirubrobacteraceae bacterium]